MRKMNKAEKVGRKNKRKRHPYVGGQKQMKTHTRRTQRKGEEDEQREKSGRKYRRKRHTYVGGQKLPEVGYEQRRRVRNVRVTNSRPQNVAARQ
jgi:hypothetical protein